MSMRLPSGIMWIGDPHASSKAPGRRIDDYAASVLGKLTEAAEISNVHNLQPVITGDLLHRAGENDLRFICALMEVLRRFAHVPLALEGNHGKAELRATPADAEHLLDLAGVIHLMRLRGAQPSSTADLPVQFEDSVGCQQEHVLPVKLAFDNGARALLIPLPHGTRIPESVEDYLDEQGIGQDTCVLAVTHHDLAFSGAHPNAKPLVEIRGVDMLVNGHLHNTMPSRRLGRMVAHNPGNIEPLSVDLIDHKPRVWAWRAGDRSFELTPFELAHQRDVFSMRGRLAEAAAPQEAAQAVQEATQGRFAHLLAQARAAQSPALATSEAFRAGLAEKLKSHNVSESAAALLKALAAQIP